MNTQIEKIYADYRNADFVLRLHLYLQFPELRNDFFEIERREIKGEDRGAARAKRVSPAN